MNIPFKIDLSSRQYHRVMDFLCPLMVGGTLAVGTLIVRPEIRAFFFSISEIGYYSKLAVLVFFCLVLGYMFIASIESLVVWVLRLTNRLTKNWVAGQIVSNPPWLSKSWQLVAREMIGDKFLPANLWADEEAKIRDAKKSAEQISDQNKKKTAMENIGRLELDLQKNARQWHGWYLILKEYFDLPDQTVRESFYAYGTVHAIGWVGILLVFVSRHFYWLPIAFCALLIAYGIRGLIYRMRCGGFFGSDNQGIPLTAAMLHDVRKDPSDKLTGLRY